MGEKRYSRLTKSDREKAIPNWYMVYEINGRRYRFDNIYLDDTGVPYGYCGKTKRWAWLYINAVSHYGKDIDLIPAVLIKNNGVILKD